jgi:hypothetical protein
MTTYDAPDTFDSGGTYDEGTTFDVVEAPEDPAAVIAMGGTPTNSVVPYQGGVPQFSVTTMRIYGRLPEFYRAADATAGSYPNDFPLLRYISLIGDQGADIEVLLNRFSYVPPFAGGTPGSTCDLVNPVTADSAWLPWMAQLYGVALTAGMTVPEQRAAIGNATAGFLAGSRQSIINIAMSQLTGGQHVQLVDHANNDPWQVQIITRASETPQPSTVVSAVIAANAKPAGVALTQIYYEATWATVEAALPTWAAWENAGTSDPLLLPGTWGAVEETQPGLTGASWATLESVLPSWSDWETAGTWAAVEAE